MKIEIEQHDIEAVAQRVAEIIKPLLIEHIEQREDDVILTINELAAIFKLKKSQIYYWVSESKYVDSPVPYMKAGKHLRFSKSQFTQWLKRSIKG